MNPDALISSACWMTMTMKLFISIIWQGGGGRAEWGHLTVTEQAASPPGIFHQINLSSLHDWISNIGYIGIFLTAITINAKMNLLALSCHVMSKVMPAKNILAARREILKGNPDITPK